MAIAEPLVITPVNTALVVVPNNFIRHIGAIILSMLDRKLTAYDQPGFSFSRMVVGGNELAVYCLTADYADLLSVEVEERLAYLVGLSVQLKRLPQGCAYVVSLR